MFGVEKGVAFPITATDQFSGAFRELKGHVTGMSGEFAKLGGLIKALGLGLSAVAVVRFAQGIVDAADQLGKLSQKTGIAVADLSALKYAASLSDVSTESLAKGVKGLAQRMTEAGDSTSKAGKIMAALGVDLSNGAAPAIDSIANAFARLPDGTTKAALAVEIFGKAGMDMIPLLNQGAAGIKGLREEAQRLGLVMSDEAGKAAEAFNDNLTSVKAAGEGAAISIFNDLAPSMVRITGAMKTAAEESGVLKAIWIAMGGIAAEALGLNTTEAEALARNLKRAQEEVSAFGEHIPGERKIALLMGAAQAGNMIEASFVKANFQLRLTQSTIDAMAGKYDDQVSRAARHGNGVVGGTDSALERRARDILAMGDAASKATKAMKDLGLADEHVTAWLKNLVAEARRVNEEVQRSIDLDEQARLAKEGAIQSFREQIEQMEFEVTLLGKSNADRQVAIALRQLEKAGIDATNPSLKAYVDRIREAVGAQEAFHGQQEMLRDQASVWDQLGDVAGSFFSDLVMNGKSAFDNLKRWAKDLLAQMIALFAKRWVLNLAAGGSMLGAAGSAFAGGAGDGSLAGGLIGAASSLLPGGAVGTAFGNIANMGASLLGASGSLASAIGSFASFIPVIGTAVAVVTMLASIFGDKGENPNFRWMQGTGGQGAFGGVSTEGNYDFNGSALLAYIGSLDARFVRLLGEEGSARASANLSAYTGAGLRSDGQPAQFAFPEGDATAAEQIAKELLQSRYGILFDEIDAQIAEQVRNWEGDSTSLQQFIETMLGVVEGLGQLNLLGLNVESLRAMQREGESLDQTFLRVANTWAWFTDNFYTEAEKLEMAEADVNATFVALGLAVPANITAFRQLVESIDLSTEAGRTMWQMLMDVAPAFLLVANATGDAAATITDSAVQITEAQRAMNEALGYGGTPLAQRARDEAQALLEEMDSLRDWALGKFTGSDSPLAPGEQLSLALDEYERALGGGSIAEFKRAADLLLSQATSFYGSSEGRTDIFNRVRADAERLGGFSLGLGGDGTVASIDQMRSELATELRLAREDNKALRQQVSELIVTIREGSKSQETATREAAAETSRAVVNAVESVTR